MSRRDRLLPHRVAAQEAAPLPLARFFQFREHRLVLSNNSLTPELVAAEITIGGEYFLPIFDFLSLSKISSSSSGRKISDLLSTSMRGSLSSKSLYSESLIDHFNVLFDSFRTGVDQVDE